MRRARPIPARKRRSSGKERVIIDAIIRDALAAGYSVDVFGDGEKDISGSTDYPTITSFIAACSETSLVMRKMGASRIWVLLVHGNEDDVIADHTDTEEARLILARANRLAA